MSTKLIKLNVSNTGVRWINPDRMVSMFVIILAIDLDNKEPRTRIKLVNDYYDVEETPAEINRLIDESINGWKPMLTGLQGR